MPIATTQDDRDAAERTWAPCFIVGHTRSGLTILLKVLAGYTPIAGCRDQGMLFRFKDLLRHYGDLSVRSSMLRLIQDMLTSYEYTTLLRGPDVDALDLYDRLPEHTYPALINALYMLKAESLGKDRWIEKTPAYSRRLPELLEMFPDARVIHMSRDGRDVAASVFRSGHGHKNGYIAGRFWSEHILAARRARTLVRPGHFHELRYEDLLGDPVGTFSDLLDFLRMDPALVEAWRKDVDTVLRRNNTHKWKTQLRSRDVRQFERAAGDTLELYGYETVTPARLRTPPGRIEAMLLRIHSKVKQLATTSGKYYRRNAFKRFQAAQIRMRSLWCRRRNVSD